MINEHQLKIVGSVNIPEELSLNTQYTLNLKADCTEKNEKSNHDGTENRIYKLELTGEVEILSETKKILGKDGKKYSKKVRDRLWEYSQRKDVGMSPESFYNYFMGKFMWNFDEIVEYTLAQE